MATPSSLAAVAVPVEAKAEPAAGQKFSAVVVMTMDQDGTAQLAGVTHAVPVYPGFDIACNVYSATVVAATVGASKNYISIYNADAALKVDVMLAYVTKEATAAITGLLRGMRLFRFTTAHSGGATPTVRKLDTSLVDALDSDITVRTASTIGGAEAEPLAVVGVGEDENNTGGRHILFSHLETGRPITLNQNEGLVIQQDSTAGTGLVSAGLLFRVR